MLIDATGLIFYMLGVIYYARYNSSIKATALFVGIGPIVFNVLYGVAMASIYHNALSGIFTFSEIVTAALQLLFAYAIFYMARRNEDSLAATWLVLTVGGLVSYAILPGIVQ